MEEFDVHQFAHMDANEYVYVYEKVPDDLEELGEMLVEWDSLPEVSRVMNTSFYFYGTYRRDGQHAAMLKEDNYLKVFCENETWQYFRISKVVPNLETVSVTARPIAFEANKNFIEHAFVSNGNGQTIMNELSSKLVFNQKINYSSNIRTFHQFTAKEVKPLEAIWGSNNGQQNLAGVTSGEVDFDNWNIKLVERIGKDSGYSLDFGVNIAAIESEIDDESIVNSLYLIGGTEENDYDQNKEPIKLKYLSVPGVNDENRRIGKRENSNCLTEEELQKWGQSLFDKDRIHEPKISHRVSMVALEYTEEYYAIYKKLHQLHFGDTAHVWNEKYQEEYEERMYEYVWYPTLKKFKSIVLGSAGKRYTAAVQTETQILQAKIENRTSMLVEAVRNATAWITGTKGGYVRFRPEKAPSEILIMDKPIASEAVKVWRWNLGGLGFSSTGVDGDYGLALTQDGAIVADFITVGILRAIDIVGVNITGSTITGTDIMGSIFETLSPDFIKMKLANGSISYFETDEEGEVEGSRIGYIGMARPGNPTLHIENEATNKSSKMWMDDENTVIMHEDLIQLRAELVRISNRLDVKELYVDGVRVTGGGSGGGGWNGQYPPEVTTQAERFAWQAWVMLISLGYSKAAAAGILGNVRGEVGPGMDPDTDQVGGPAYGAIQFDGSAYPLVGEPTWDGREYVQRLMAEAGITEDYRLMTTQMRLVNWAMTNGQWIGVVNPTTVEGFKNATSPETAAHAFERNFERPAAAHPEREGWAREWYDKFVNLVIDESNGWAVPMARPFTVSSEFGPRTSPITGQQELHNGIDLVNGNATTPIYASGAGEVVVSMFEQSYGNYVVILHSNGIYTGYAHMSARDVSVGQNVLKGQKIGNMGSTGDSTGAHLHFQFFRNGPWPSSDDFVDPREHINF